MPKYMLEVPDNHHAVTRPIIRHVAEQVIRNFGLEHYQSQIVINGLNEVIPLNNSTLGEGNNQIRIDSDSRLEVEFEEEVINPVSIAIMRDEHKPVLWDNQLRVQLRPVYTEVQLTLSFKFIAPDQSSATTWQTRAQLQAYREMNKFLTNVDYHYTIPYAFTRLLQVIHAVRERGDFPRDERFGQWVRRVSTNRMTTIANVAGSGKVLAIPELQSRVHGWFNFGYEPQKVERHNQASSWMTSFDITLHYDRVDAIIMTYPLMIHNQIIPSEFRDESPIEKDIEYVRTDRSLSLQSIGWFEIDAWKNAHTPRANGVGIPHFDDWVPEHIEYEHCNTTHILLQFDLEDPKFVIDFADDDAFGDYAMHYYVQDYMRDLNKHMFILFDTVFLTSVQRWNDGPPIRDLEVVNDDLKVDFKYDHDLRHMYHLVINTLLDLELLSEIGRRILGRHPRVVEGWLKWRFPDEWYKIPIPFNLDGTVNIDLLIKIIKDRSLWDHNATPGKPALWNTYDDDPTKRSGWRYGQYNGEPGMNMHLSFNIIAYRKGEPFDAYR